VTPYLMAVYGDKDTEEWFRQRYALSGKKLNMGKSCVHFKTPADVPVEVISEAIAKVPVQEYIEMYKAARPARQRQMASKSLKNQRYWKAVEFFLDAGLNVYGRFVYTRQQHSTTLRVLARAPNTQHKSNPISIAGGAHLNGARNEHCLFPDSTCTMPNLLQHSE